MMYLSFCSQQSLSLQETDHAYTRLRDPYIVIIDLIVGFHCFYHSVLTILYVTWYLSDQPGMACQNRLALTT